MRLGDFGVLPRLGAGVVMAVVGIIVAQHHPIIGIVLVAIGTVSTGLAVRALRESPNDNTPEGGTLSRSALDLIIWTSLGIPVVMAILLVILVVAER